MPTFLFVFCGTHAQTIVTALGANSCSGPKEIRAAAWKKAFHEILQHRIDRALEMQMFSNDCPSGKGRALRTGKHYTARNRQT